MKAANALSNVEPPLIGDTCHSCGQLGSDSQPPGYINVKWRRHRSQRIDLFPVSEQFCPNCIDFMKKKTRSKNAQEVAQCLAIRVKHRADCNTWAKPGAALSSNAVGDEYGSVPRFAWKPHPNNLGLWPTQNAFPSKWEFENVSNWQG